MLHTGTKSRLLFCPPLVQSLYSPFYCAAVSVASAIVVFTRLPVLLLINLVEFPLTSDTVTPCVFLAACRALASQSQAFWQVCSSDRRFRHGSEWTSCRCLGSGHPARWWARRQFWQHGLRQPLSSELAFFNSPLMLPLGSLVSSPLS